MRNLTNDERYMLTGLAKIEVRRWASVPDKQYMVDLMNIAINALEQQGGWISCSERMPKSDGTYLAWDGRYVTSIAFMFGNWQCNQLILPKISHWQPLPSPPQPQPSTTPHIDNDVWIEWGGGDNPAVGKFVQVQFRDGMVDDEQPSASYRWYHDHKDCDIVAYRVIENEGSGEKC